MSNAVNTWGAVKFNFKVFSDRLDFITKSKAAYEFMDTVPTAKYNFSGKERSFSNEVEVKFLTKMENVTEYENRNELEKYLDSFDEIMSNIDMGGAFKKSRLKITSDERGIFSFGLASKGLYKPVEYFSAELAVDSPNEFPEKPTGIVEANYVREIELFGIKQFWYESPTTKKRYQLTKQQEGEREVQLGLRNTPILRTSNKKSYVMFEKKGGKAKMVELYLPLHREIELKNMIPLLLVARFLRTYGVMVRISTIRMFKESFWEFYGWGYPIKDYGDEFDFNFMALNGVDTRWWESVRVGVRSITAKKNYEEKGTTKISWGQGEAPGKVSDYVEVFSRYRNWYMEQIEKGELEPLRVDKKLMLIGGAFGNYTTDAGMIKEFFRILDTVDFQFNKTEESLKRIYVREVEDVLQKYYSDNVDNFSADVLISKMDTLKVSLINNYKIYIQKLLIDTYTYPDAGEYAEPKESADKLDEEFDDKIEKMGIFLKNI